MDNRKLASALAALPKETVEKLVRAADALRSVETLMGAFTPPKVRKKRGPNKPKPTPVEALAAKPLGGRGLSGALDRLKAKKAPGLKVRKTRVEEDED